MKHTQEQIFVRHNGKFARIELCSLLYVESKKNFVCFHFAHDTLLILITLRQLEQELPDYFCRVHRSYIVNSRLISSFDYEHVWFDKRWIPVSAPYKSALIFKVKVIVSDQRPFPGIPTFDVHRLT